MRKTKAVNNAAPKVDVVLVPVHGHGVTMSSGKAKIYSTPGLIGGSWTSRTGEVLSRRDDERCIPIKVIVNDYNPFTGYIEVKGSWIREEGQADLRDYVALRASKMVPNGTTSNGCSPLTAALNLVPQDVPSSGKAGDFFVGSVIGYATGNKLYFHNGLCWNRVIMEPCGPDFK